MTVSRYDKQFIEEECLALQAIFGQDKCKLIKADNFPTNTVDTFYPPTVLIDLYDIQQYLNLLMQVEFQFPKYYPAEAVKMRIVNSNNLPKNIVNKSVNFSQLLASEKVGDAMIYDIVMELNHFLISEITGKTSDKNQINQAVNGIPRIAIDKKNSNFFFNDVDNKIILKRQCTEDIEHFSNEEFLANGFTCMNNNDSEKKTQSVGLIDDQYNVWCYKNPEIIIIQNSSKPTDLPLEISAKNVEKEDVDEWLALFLRQYDVSSQTNLLESLITWIKSYLELAVANNIDDNVQHVNHARVRYFVPNEYTLEKLPPLQEMEKAIGRPIETGRKLHIITWGDKKECKSTITQLGAEAHFNAKPLDGRGGGADLKVNATHDPRIVRNGKYFFLHVSERCL
jgi:hypothetical protein